MQTPTEDPAEISRKTDYAVRMAERRAALARDSRAILPAGTRFTWEVGCGHGHFLAAYAAAHPSETCVGIDIMSDRIERARRKRDRAQLANLHFLRADARLFLETLPEDVGFSGAFILFPDPWPKVRHHKHRIIQPDFLSLAAQHATPAARLCFRTDYQPYFAEAAATFARHAAWQIVDEPWPFEFDTVFQSRALEHQSLIARRSPHLPPP